MLLAEVRETSRKPDELYEIIERLLSGREGGGRKVELFGRTHNLRDGWSVGLAEFHLYSCADLKVDRLTIGNQFGKKDQLFEPALIAGYQSPSS